MIIVSEIGDRTFFIAAIMAMSNSRQLIFLSAASALLLMTVLSVIMGMSLPRLLSPEYTKLASCILYFIFGVKILHGAITGDDDGDELEEVEKELHEVAADRIDPNAPIEMEQISTEESDLEMGTRSPSSSSDSASPKSVVLAEDARELLKQRAHSHWLSPRRCFSPIAIQCFVMTFLAEWGDRSQITTIAMSASQDALGVCLGSFIAHCLCTALAVVGGKFLASRISERTVGFISGALFLFFAVHGLYQAHSMGALRLPSASPAYYTTGK